MKSLNLSFSLLNSILNQKEFNPVTSSRTLSIDESKNISLVIENEEVEIPLVGYENVSLVIVEATYNENDNTNQEGADAPFTVRHEHGGNPHTLVTQSGFCIFLPVAGQLEQLFIGTASTTPVRLNVYLGTTV